MPKGKKKSQLNSASAIGDKTVHVQNLLRKGNMKQIEKMAAQGIQAAVDVVNARASAKAQSKENKKPK